MSRAQAQEASYPFKVHSMKSLKKTALTVSCKQLLSFMPVPGRITMQPFKKSSPAPRMPNRMKVGAQQGLISQVNLRSCMSALLSGEKLVSPLPGTHLPPMMLLHPAAEEPTCGPSHRLPLNTATLHHVACPADQAAGPDKVEVRSSAIQDQP